MLKTKNVSFTFRQKIKWYFVWKIRPAVTKKCQVIEKNFRKLEVERKNFQKKLSWQLEQIIGNKIENNNSHSIRKQPRSFLMHQINS